MQEIKSPYSFEPSLYLGFTQRPLLSSLPYLLDRAFKYFIWHSMQAYRVAATEIPTCIFTTLCASIFFKKVLKLD
jgi:hypothetical protein